MNKFDIQDHIKFRNDRYTEIDKTNPKLLGLSVIEINPTELCNRTCSFCPRHDPEIYPNRNLNMSIETANVLIKQLEAVKFTGDIHITGYGEPLLNPDILKIIEIFSKKFHTELITNGDRLLNYYYKLQDLEQVGLNLLIVDCYDGDEHVNKMQELMVDCKIPFRIRNHHDTGSKELITLYNFNNRGGLTDSIGNRRPCWLPMYKAFIDWNGDLGLCCNDWSRKQTFGNIHSNDISELWMSEDFVLVRKQLLEGKRDMMSSCTNCNTNGTVQGKESSDLWQNH
jgi:MoaA/NifB/PqqE/SkfB family radical SAM enzyme